MKIALTLKKIGYQIPSSTQQRLIWISLFICFAQYYTSTAFIIPSPLFSERMMPPILRHRSAMEGFQRRLLIRSYRSMKLASVITCHLDLAKTNIRPIQPPHLQRYLTSKTYMISSPFFHRRSFTLQSKIGTDDEGGGKTSTEDDFLDNLRRSICDQILTQLPHRQGADSSADPPLVILLGVSGGCDSVALFHSVLALTTSTSSSENGFEISCKRKTTSCQLHVVHFDHQQRGEQSNCDRRLVEELCKEHGIEFHCFYWNDMLDRGAKFSQESARDWRRTKSIELLKDIIGCDDKQGLIFTAHHKDDSEETMLLKLLRGVHITNISGMEILQRASEESDIYFAKPMLNVRKCEINDFLTSRNLEWREDESNASDKYLRNRVRNELMPLLNDLVGGQSVLESRLKNAEEQSRKLKRDISLRIDDQLSHSISSDAGSTIFRLPDNEGELSVLEEEALFRWVGIASNNIAALSYEKLNAICQQIVNYPDRRQWKIGIGENWDVARNGNVLMLVNNLRIYDEENVNVTNTEWTLSSIDDMDPGSATLSSHHLSIHVPLSCNDIEPQFVLDKAKGNASLKFLPPWRKGGSEMKVKEFLRGQKVSLHRRDEAPLLCIQTGNALRIAAVFVESDEKGASGRWVIHSDFDTNYHPTSDDIIRREIVLIKSLL